MGNSHVEMNSKQLWQTSNASIQAETDSELSFKKNQVITLLRKIDDNWYEGELDNKIGIFPSR